MPKLSVSLPNEHYEYLQKLSDSMSKAIQIVIAEHMEQNGWTYIPGRWEKHEQQQ